MKKTLVALAVASAAVFTASSASAAVTVYNQDGTKVEVDGSVRVFLGRVKAERSDLKNDGSRLIIKASQDFGDGLSLFGGYQLRFNGGNKNDSNKGAGSDFNDPTTKHLLVGLKQEDIGTLSFGRQATSADDFLNDSAYYSSASNSPLTTSMDKGIKFRSAEWNGFSLGLDYLFGNSDKTADGIVGSGSDAYYRYKSGHDAVLFYNKKIDQDQSVEATLLYAQNRYQGLGSETGSTLKQWGAHVGYVYSAFDIKASYVKSNFSYKGALAATADSNGNLPVGGVSRYILVDAGYHVLPESRLYAQWERADGNYDSTGYTDEVTNTYTAGIDYKLNKRMLTYVEYSHSRAKQTATSESFNDNTFGVGLRVYF